MTVDMKQSRENFEIEVRKRIDELLSQKRFNEAATLAVNIAFLNIDPEELVKLLLDGIKEWKAKHP